MIAVNQRILEGIVIMVECWFEHHLLKQGAKNKPASSIVPCQIHLKWWVDQIWDASSHKVRSSNLLSWVGDCLWAVANVCTKSAQWELFYHVNSKLNLKLVKIKRAEMKKKKSRRKKWNIKKKVGEKWILEKSVTLLCFYQLETQFKWKTSHSGWKLWKMSHFRFFWI